MLPFHYEPSHPPCRAAARRRRSALGPERLGSARHVDPVPRGLSGGSRLRAEPRRLGPRSVDRRPARAHPDSLHRRRPSIIPLPAAISAIAPAAHKPVASIAAANAVPGSPASRVAPALEALELGAAAKNHDRGGRGRDWKDQLFDGTRGRDAAREPAHPAERSGPKGFIKNSDGVWVGGRVAEQALWINKMAAELSPIIDLADVLDVMDDAYDEARVKLKSVEAATANRSLDESSVHLEGTRNWVDAILTDGEGRSIAVHTHRVYFHPGRGNADSEISEGIRRVGKYLDKAKEDFAEGGLAEQELDRKFHQVELAFDTRGYKEIEAYIAERAKEFGPRWVFRYITEPKVESKDLRREYNRLVEKYGREDLEQTDGLMGILDGVTYSREVGVGHELNSHKKRLQMGLKVTQAGRDFFGKTVLPDGRIVETYKTEFDAVTEARGPKGEREVTLWEDKSTRVWMPLDKTMEETFLYKLRIYRENRALIEESLGAPLKVAFSVDVGGANRRAAKQGFLVWKDPRQAELLEHLKAIGPALSAEFGFPVSFIFVNSHPGESPDLFNQEAVSEADWMAMNGGGKKGGGRKHGRGGRR
ncbi:MAG: hypothetical protein M0D55_15455 [Elusimicrobiota bacterium]|nr:MAG: hypothetical protein M0D55_15455 [Elusimicrobiota bacterium]